MESSIIIAIVFGGVAVFMLIISVVAKTCPPPKEPKIPKELYPNADAYRRYKRYTFAIVLWVAAVAIYIVLLEHIVRANEFMGARGTSQREVNFQILSFFRTAFAIVHVPIMTAILAATIPYWTMTKSDSCEHQVTADAGYEGPGGPSTTVSQFLHLADRTWAGAYGWAITVVSGWKDGAISTTWLHLALVSALSYAGFPLLSLSYVLTSKQYWLSQSMPATTAVGGLSGTYADVLRSLQQPSQWMDRGLFSATASLNTDFFINSTVTNVVGYDHISNDTSWANNRTLITLPLSAMGQLPTAGVKTFASCTYASYNFTEFIPEFSLGSPRVLEFDFTESTSNVSDSSPYFLRCKNDCADLNAQNALGCSAHSSMVNITPGPRVSVLPGPEYNSQPMYLGQTLSCIQQTFDDWQSIASIQLAVQGPGPWTRVASCEFSVTYLQPTVNTLTNQYMETVDASSSVPVIDMSPVTLLNLSMNPFVSFFHQGPPNNPAPALSDGFTWISEWNPVWVEMCSTPENNCMNRSSDSWALLSIANPSSTQYSSFDENVFLKPLAHFINDRAFFRNGTTEGVAFSTDLQLSHGHIPPAISIIVLTLPIVWTIILSIVTNRERRWTATLDSFAIFRLGGDWHSNLKEYRLSSLRRARDQVLLIPGNVVVDPVHGTAKLGHGAKTRKRRRIGEKSNKESDPLVLPT